MARGRLLAWLGAGLAIALLGSLAYRMLSPGLPVVDLELAGSAGRATEVVGPALDSSVLDAWRREVSADWVFVPAYVAGLVVTGLAAARAGAATWTRRSARAGVLAAVLAGLFDVAENLLLLRGLDDLPGGDAAFAAARVCALAKFSLVGFAVVAVLAAVVGALVRPGPRLPAPDR